MNFLIAQPELCGAGGRQVSKPFLVLDPVLLEIHTAIKSLDAARGQEERTSDLCRERNNIQSMEVMILPTAS